MTHHVVPEAEALLDTPTPVLDHGFVTLVDYMGSDKRIVDAARLSIAGEGVRPVSEDRALIRYLMANRHCYAPEMEVLTARGWVRWDACEASETFLVPYPDRRELHPERLDVECFDAEEELCCHRNNRMSYRVTPDHRMWFRNKHKAHFEVVRAAEMLRWGHFDPLNGYSLKGVNLNSTGDMKAMFVGFYLGDGSYASLNTITFHLNKDRKKRYLNNLLEVLGLTFKVKPSSTYPDDALVYIIETPAFLREWLGSYLNARSAGKNIIKKVEQLTGLEVTGLLDGLVNSDGSEKEDRPQTQFSSTSKALCDLFEALCAMGGWDAHKAHGGADFRVIAYYGDRTTLEARKDYFYTEFYRGKVYCATSGSGLLMVRGGPDKFAFVCGNTTPFEMVEFTFHAKMPIFVARQWVRHRMASINEMSARYSELPEEFYVPEIEHIQYQDKKNKQGRAETVDPAIANQLAMTMTIEAKGAFDTYHELLGRADAPLRRAGYRIPVQELAAGGGVARELARINLPLSTYTAWYWKIDLHNLLHFLSLRLDQHAQYEIRVYAEAMVPMVKAVVPIAWEAFEDFRLGGMGLSKLEVEALGSVMRSGCAIEPPFFQTKREHEAFLTKLKRLGLIT